jgi:hypothetical protein
MTASGTAARLTVVQAAKKVATTTTAFVFVAPLPTKANDRKTETTAR